MQRQPWANSPLFSTRRTVDFQLQPEQFFPMGDNSGASSDARSWRIEQLANEELHSETTHDRQSGIDFLASIIGMRQFPCRTFNEWDSFDRRIFHFQFFLDSRRAWMFSAWLFGENV